MRTFLLLLFALVIWKASAQSPWLQRPDSLKEVLKSPVDDETRLQVLYNLTVRYIWSSPDSAIPYAQQYMLLAQKKKSDNLLITAYSLYGGVAQNTGNFAQALAYRFKALAIAEGVKNLQHISDAYHGISEVYLVQGDIERSIVYAHKGLDILKANYSLPIKPPTQANDTSNRYASLSYTLCKAFVKIGQPDSAAKYIKPVEWIWGYQWQNPKKRWPTVPLTYGNINYLRENYVAAKRYYHEGAVAAEFWDTQLDLMENLNGLAKTHRKINQWDSAIYYARKVLQVGETAQNPILKMEALTLLSGLFKMKNNVDSTAKYFELTLATKDSLFNQSKMVEIQNSTFNEQLRQQEMEDANTQRTNRYRSYSFVAGLAVLILISLVLYRNMQVKQKAKVRVEKAFAELKAAQTQLIQSEKMASLGELTAGIAHEIQNPLNFVNNFSEVNEELLVEMKDELGKGKIEDAIALASDAIENQKKINHHGKRADAIVKGMLQHSRASSGQKEPTDINALCDEYLRLSYHGLRAKDKTFNAIPINIGIETNFDSTLEKINVIPQDIGRVILNLINNAFYSVTEKKKKLAHENYEPTITVTTKKLNARPADAVGQARPDGPFGRARPDDPARGKIQIIIKDNGNGIPDSVKDKIFQPFFTTKPTGQGTGLGLSLSYDIVTKGHGGELKVESIEGKGTELIIILPL